MTNKHRQLQYSPRRRRIRLAETRRGPILLLLGACAALAAAALICIRLIPLAAQTSSPHAETGTVIAAASEEIPFPVEEEETGFTGGTAGTVVLADVADAAVLSDPSVNGDAILFAAGLSADVLDRLVRYDTVTGEAEGVLVPMRYDTLRNPVEDDARIVYVDARSGGGGAIRTLDKATGEAGLVCETALDIPVLYYETPYLLWKERTADGATKLYACHLGTFDAVTLAVPDTAAAAQSQPALYAGEAVYATADPANAAHGVIRRVHLTDGDTTDYAPGTAVHDPKCAEGAMAWMTGFHGADSDLYIAVSEGTAVRIAQGIVDFGIARNLIVYGKDRTVFVYDCSTGETLPLSGENERAQYAAAGGSCIVWRDMDDPAHPIWKYMRID